MRQQPFTATEPATLPATEPAAEPPTTAPTRNLVRIASAPPARLSVQPRGTRRVRVSVNCNEARDGAFRGRASMLAWEPLDARGRALWQIEFDHDDFIAGLKFSVDDARLVFRLQRRAWPFCSRRAWHGNFCWDSFDMQRPAALRLLAALRDSGQWHCTSAPSAVARWLDDAGRRRHFAQVNSARGPHAGGAAPWRWALER